MRRFSICSALALGSCWFGCSLDAAQPLDVRESHQAAVASESTFYLRCNSTGWDLTSANRFVPTANADEFEVDYAVTQSWMVEGNDACSITETDDPTGWGSHQIYYGLRNASQLIAPSTALLEAGASTFAVKYPALGRYNALVNRRYGTFTIKKAATFRTTVSVDQTICAGLASELGAHCENQAALEGKVRSLFTAVNHIYNDPGVFSHKISFVPAEIGTFTGDPEIERWRDHPGFDIRMVLTIDPAVSNTFVAPSSVRINGKSAQDAFDRTKDVAHELAHALRMYDLKGMLGWDCAGTRDIMTVGEPEYPYWTPTTTHIIDAYVDSPDREHFPYGLLVPAYVPSVVRVTAKDANGLPLANAEVRIYATNADDVPLVDPVFAGVTDAQGTFALPPNPYVDTSDPTRLAYHHLLAETHQTTAHGIEVGQADLPMWDAQLAVFERRALAVDMIRKPVARGDASGNGSVDIRDALIIGKRSQGTPVTPFYPETADANCDGAIDLTDANLVATAAMLGQPLVCP